MLLDVPLPPFVPTSRAPHIIAEPAPGAATEGVRAAWIDRRLAVFGGSTTSADGVGELSDQLRVWELSRS